MPITFLVQENILGKTKEKVQPYCANEGLLRTRWKDAVVAPMLPIVFPLTHMRRRRNHSIFTRFEGGFPENRAKLCQTYSGVATP